MSIRIKDKERLRDMVSTMDAFQDQDTIDLSELFINKSPMVLDAGCGKGEFLLDQAIDNPNVNFIGVDYSWKKCLYSQKKIVNNNIQNGYIIRAAFENLFPKFPDQCFETIFMNFPDPWPKHRHHNRRSLTESLVDQYARLLKPGGNFYFVTDCFEYAEWSFPKIEANNYFENQIKEGWYSNSLNDYSKTLFCGKAEEKGTKINYLKFKRV
ncbi:MAG: tRNA (guanosine(46)-N7)-methyltransferase TrmB [Planctomycetota bacterium]|nr:MAG: tRNA (guanosine(46)-N7)-methyltransferase TrmB [Planctomycetota bacterium]